MSTLASASVSASLPAREHPNGPVTRRRQSRTLLVYLGFCALGALPWLLHWGPAWCAIGLGFWFPGAGFIAVGGWHLLWLPLTLILFALALFAWFGSGNILAPALVWGLSAAGAGVAAGATVTPAALVLVPAVVAALAALTVRYKRREFARALQRRAARLAALPRAMAEVEQRAVATPDAATRELSESELAATRFLYDRGLQPVESLDGLEIIEQFQPAALRYQIFDLHYALAHLQCQYAPNFHGYLSQAQRNLIEKVVRPEIWGYWKWESLWGRFTTDFDPVVKDNIMLTGFYGICLGLYAANTGDQRYAAPGALEFRLNSGQRYPHDLHSIMQALVRNFENSAYCLYPCEPNWIYTFCNLQGMTALAIYDRLYGTRHVERLRARFVENWREEFTTIDGSVLPIRSSITGLTIPGLIGTSGDTSGSVLAGAMLPDIAARMWAQARSEAISFDAQGRLVLKVTGADKMDPGNYRKGLGMTYTTVLFAAREYGDEEVAQAALRRLDEEFEPTREGGSLRYRRLSVLANAMLVRARINRRGDWRRTVTQGPQRDALKGPVLAQAEYPAVLVARAFSDGTGLDLTLYPGSGPGTRRLGIERLQPHCRYIIKGVPGCSRAVADAEGRLQLDVVPAGRTAVSIVTE
jgi:hypothetical protein